MVGAFVVGDDWRHPHPARARRIGLVPQDLAIYPELTATENLAYFGRLQGLREAALTARTGEVLELVGLADRAKKATKNFSGGMKRRLNIGVGLLHRPACSSSTSPPSVSTRSRATPSWNRSRA